MFRWHGHTNVWESLYIFPGGFGTGVAQSAVFVSLQAVIAHPSHLAPAISFMYLTTTVALTIGLPLSDAVMRGVLRRVLEGRLIGLGLGVGEVRKVGLLSLYFSFVFLFLCGLVWCERRFN